MVNRKARSPGKLTRLNTQGQVSTKPGVAVDPNAGVWFSLASDLRRVGKGLGNLVDRTLKKREQAEIDAAKEQGKRDGFNVDLGIGEKDQSDIGRKLMADLQKDFGLSQFQAAGFVGNLAHESGGFKTLQEIKPLVPGSKGGFGYAQWTGPRRKQFEAFAKKNNLDPTSYEANYGFLKHELQNTSEGKVLDLLRKTGDARSAAKVVSERFLRPGIPHMESRLKWADQFASSQTVSTAGTGRPSPNGPALALRSDTPRGAAYEAAQNRSISRRLPIEVNEQLEGLYEEHKDDPEALAAAFDEAQGNVLGRLKALTDDPELLYLGEATFAQKRKVFERTAAAEEDRRVRDSERSDYDSVVQSSRSSLQRQAYLAANDEEAGIDLSVAIGETMASIDDALGAGLIKPSLADKQRRDILDTVTVARAEGVFDSLPGPDKKVEFVAGLMDEWKNNEGVLQGFSLEKVQAVERKFASQIAKERKRETAELRLQAKKMERLVTDDLASISETGIGLQMEGEELDYDQVKATLGEDRAAEWQRDRVIKAETFKAKAGLELMPIPEMMDHLESLEPKAGTPGYVDQMAIRSNVQAEAKRIAKLRKEDPAEAVDQAFEELQGLKSQAMEGDLMALEELMKGRLDAQESLGISDYSKSVLTKLELEALARPMAKEVDRDAWLTFGRQVDETYGPFADEVMAQVMHWKGLNKTVSDAAAGYLRKLSLGERPSRSEARTADETLGAVTADDAMDGAFDEVKWKAMPNQTQIAHLLANPDLANSFDDKFGPGASAFYLRAQQRSQEQTERFEQGLKNQGVTYNADGSEDYDPSKDKKR